MSSDPTTAGEGPADHDPRPDYPRSGLRQRPAVADVAVVVGGFLVLGLVAGLLWWLLVDPATFTKVDDGGSMGENELGKRFNGDGWYAVIAAVAGLGAGIGFTWWRSRDFLLTVVLLLAGSGGAAAVMALTGRVLGPGDPDAALAAAEQGARVPVQLEVTAEAAYLVWPIAALIGSLVVLWSPGPAPAENGTAPAENGPGRHSADNGARAEPSQ